MTARQQHVPDRPAVRPLIDAGVGDPRHSDLQTTPARQRSTPSSVTHGHASRGGRAEIAAAHPAASFSKHPWPGEDAHYDVPWRSLGDGAVVRAGDETLQALHTPGHSPDHLAFWHEPTRTIFTGDLVIQGSSVMIHWSRGGDLGQYLASLERLLALNPRRLLRRTARQSTIRKRFSSVISSTGASASGRCSTRSAPDTPACRPLPNPSAISRTGADAGGAGKRACASRKLKTERRATDEQGR
jgi:hypothetical protein